MFKFKRLVVITVILILFANLTISSSAYDIDAKAYVLINADTLDIIDSSNAHLRLSMASTTKILTALILAEQDNLDKEVVTTKEMVTVEGSSMGLLPGDTVSYYELLVGMMLPSGNDAANTAAISISGSTEKFADVMNAKAAELGMTNSHFVTPSGLDNVNHYSTAYDMALLTVAALKNDTLRNIFSQTKITVTYGNPPYQRTLYNHNKLLDEYEYCIGVKTGYTKKSGRCLVSAASKDGCTVIAVTLNDSDDWNDHKALLDYGFSKLCSYDATPNLSSNSVNVVGGEKEYVLMQTEPFLLGVDCSDRKSVVSQCEFKPFVYAPIKQGDKIGEVNYFYNGKYLKSTDIVATEDIVRNEVKLNSFQILVKKLKYIFSSYI